MDDEKNDDVILRRSDVAKVVDDLDDSFLEMTGERLSYKDDLIDILCEVVADTYTIGKLLTELIERGAKRQIEHEFGKLNCDECDKKDVCNIVPKQSKPLGVPISGRN